MTKHVKDHIQHSVNNIIYLSNVSSSHSSQNEDSETEEPIVEEPVTHDQGLNQYYSSKKRKGTIKSEDILKNIKGSILSKPKHIKRDVSLRKGIKLLKLKTTKIKGVLT